VADGFRQDANSGFTCREAGTSGSFCDVSDAGLTRTGNFAISITGADSVSELPEPGSMGLLIASIVHCTGGVNILKNPLSAAPSYGT
jgi:hypothetical protein